MAESMQVQGPIEVKDNSAERVAYDLMTIIANSENNYPREDCAAKKASTRLYHLTLYTECLAAVRGRKVPDSDSSLG